MRATSPVGPYHGTYAQAGDDIRIDFHWGAWQNLGQAAADWHIAGYTDADFWTIQPIPPYPVMKYDSYILIAKNDIWNAQIHITS